MARAAPGPLSVVTLAHGDDVDGNVEMGLEGWGEGRGVANSVGLAKRRLTDDLEE